ncbi:MAG: zinc-ribbon domain-containing protein [Solirubrobacteraceae bacterium]
MRTGFSATLCGGWYRAIGSMHLIKGHGWRLDQYRQAFGLLARDRSCAEGVSRKLTHHTRGRIAAGEFSPGGAYRAPDQTPGRGVRPSESLAAVYPELVAQLDPELNAGVDPFKLGPRSGKKLCWRCPDCQHVWSAAPHDRARGNGCPVCAIARRAESNRRVQYQRALAAKHADLAAQLHPTLNPGLDPATLAAGSERKVWWRCPECGHGWQTAPASRVRGHGCPACGHRRTAAAVREHRRRVAPERSLAVRRPDLAGELHPTLNPGVDATTLAAYSNRPVWWLCPSCDNEWAAAPNARHNVGRCPACRGHLGPTSHPSRIANR